MTAVGLNTSTVRVTWVPVERRHANGRITGYELIFAREETIRGRKTAPKLISIPLEEVRRVGDTGTEVGDNCAA